MLGVNCRAQSQSLDLVGEEELGVLVQAIRGLPLFCKDTPELVRKIVDILVQILGSVMSSMEAGSDSPPKKKLSCAKCFDALWFCYSPVHQMQQYYRLGVLDNCHEKWSAFTDCLMLKTKRASDVQEILEAREKSKSHIWCFRTAKATSDNWKKLYGHLDEFAPEN